MAVTVLPRVSSDPYPVTCANGEYSIVQGLTVSDFSRDLMQKTEKELSEERDAVAHLLP